VSSAPSPCHVRVALPRALSGVWAPGISDEQCDELKEDCAPFSRDMADAALKDLELLPQDASEDPEAPEPSS
jgi:hypothetical protein